MATCGKCGRTIQFFESHCECGEFHSFPNVRIAREEVAQLAARYNQDRATAFTRDTNAKLDAVEQMAESANPIINMSVRAADNILRGDKYRNYYQMLAAGLRLIAEMTHHAERGKVDATIFPEYYPHIISLALSPDGRGLTSYGPVAMTVNDKDFLELRASLLERNTYKFYDEHDLGGRKNIVLPGYRSSWSERSTLATTKLAKSVSSSSVLSDIQEMFLKVTDDREKDEFIEVHVFSLGGIRREKFSSVKLQEALTDEDDQDRWRLIQRSGNQLGIPVVG